MKELTTWDAAIKAVAPRYRNAAASEDLSWAQEKIHAMSVVAGSKGLKECTPTSIYSAVLQAASMGLTLNPVKGHCYLIPRAVKKGSQTKIAYASPSYKGLIHLAVTGGLVRFLRAEVVFEADKFEYRGPVDKPVHIPTIKPGERVEAKAIGVYAVAKTVDGDWLAEYVDRATVQRIRQMSDFPGGTMWHPDKLWTEGWKKAAIRRMAKTVPELAGTPQIEAAAAVMDAFEGLAEKTDDEPTHPVEPRATLEQVEEMRHLSSKWTTEQVNTYLVHLRVESFEDLAADRAERVIANMKKREGEAA